MNKKILTVAGALVAASLSFGFETWFGDQGVYQINTELDAGTETAGYWFQYADDSDGGKSSIAWPVAVGNEYSDDALDPVIDACSGVCGTYTLGKGTLSYDPFVGLGFNIAGEDANGTPTAADASAMGGFCVAFSVDHIMTLELGLGDAKDAALEYDNPAFSAGKSTTGTVKEVPWASFKQAGWGKGEKITGDEAAAILVSLKFKIQGKDATTGKVNIMSVGALSGGCKTTDGGSGDAIGATAMQSSLKAQLSGRTLSFGKAVAKAELVNLQGQVVMAASSVKAMDLSKLQAGVYMVRAEGLSQQIMLK